MVNQEVASLLKRAEEESEKPSSFQKAPASKGGRNKLGSDFENGTESEMPEFDSSNNSDRPNLCKKIKEKKKPSRHC